MKKLLFLTAIMACFALLIGQMAVAAENGANLFKTHCAGCHGQKAERSVGGTDPIGGKPSADIDKMLHGFKAGTFGGPMKGTMENVVRNLDDAQMKALSDYVSTL